MGNRILDLVGERFGLLTVTKRSEEKTKNGNYKWECVCDCGNVAIISGSKLKSGHTKSCGCYRYTYSKMENEYDLSGEYGIGYCRKNHYCFYFDKEDYDKIKDHCWYESHGYILTVMNFESVHKAVQLHRFLLGVTDKSVYIDHINCKKNDNRKNNLRICTPSQNEMNKPARKNSSTGYKGVVKRGNKYQSSITKNGKYYYLGLYDTMEKACEARLNAEQELFGEFAYKGDVDIA